VVAVRLHDILSLRSNIDIGLVHARFVQNAHNGEAIFFLLYPSLIFGTTEPIYITFGVRSLNTDEGKELIMQFRNSCGI
jgi:hypothetical protein